MLPLLTLLLAPAVPATLPEPPALIRFDGDDHHQDHGRKEGWRRDERRDRKEDRREDRREDREDRREDRRERHEERREARREDRWERDYWRRHREWRKHDYFIHRDRHPSPPWMGGWWRPGERHYCAVVPGDPSRIYVFVGGRWVLRRVADPRFRSDLSGAFSLPVVPPPIPPPHLGLNLHIVLFD